MRKICFVITTPIACTSAFAQKNTALGNGQLANSATAAVPQSAVTVSNINTGLTLTPQPGVFRLTSGFQTFEFELSVNRTARVDAITASERSVLIENETSFPGQVISSLQVPALPWNGRNPFALAALAPGAWPQGSFDVGLNTTCSAVLW